MGGRGDSGIVKAKKKPYPLSDLRTPRTFICTNVFIAMELEGMKFPNTMITNTLNVW